MKELEDFVENYQPILEFNQQEIANKKVRQTYYQSLFSVSESIEKINSETIFTTRRQ